MLFSIIIPVYNVEKYLGECIESILNQIFTDYEIILVDDGATDSSGRICDFYAEKHSQITVIHKPNGGSSDARNVGTAAAKGDYIIYVDSDDYVISSAFLENLHNHLNDKKTDIVLYKFREFADGETKLKPCSFSLERAASLESTDDILSFLVSNDAFYACAWTKAIRRGLLTDSGILFEKGLTGEDNEWYLHLLASSDCAISVIDKPYIAYRQRSGSISKTNKLKNLTDFVCVLEKWSVGIAAADISEKRKNALYGAMAKYYSNLLIGYVRNHDAAKKEYKSRIKALAVLLNYSQSKRPIMVRKVYRLFGLDGCLFMLKVLDKMKG